MSEDARSGWDDLQYPYGILNIKNLSMPFYPNFAMVKDGEGVA